MLGLVFARVLVLVVSALAFGDGGEHRHRCDDGADDEFEHCGGDDNVDGGDGRSGDDAADVGDVAVGAG
eukprot:234021-Alexandrium_andersonii.AAC.1